MNLPTADLWSILMSKATDVALIYFWHGSYVKTYCNIIMGGVHVYLSSTDAEYVATLGALSEGL